jgi:hypothetical protein
MTKFIYLSDVQNARRKLDDAQSVRWIKEDAKANTMTEKFTVRTDIDSRIGALINKNGVKYYTYVGTQRKYVEGTPEHLTDLLSA